ncbi:radical SAM protein [Archaeoglobus sp.]
MLEKVLQEAVSEPLTQDETLYVLNKVQTIEDFLELAKVASKVRDDEVGAVFKFDGFIGSITPCTTNPPCKYCSRSAGNRPDFAEKPITVEEVELGAKLIESTGTKRVELGGGTLWNGAGEKVLEAVKAVKRVSSMDIWINVGPSLTKDDLIKLKDLGVKEVCSSLETINPEVFKDAKPGDSLEARMKLAEEINEVGLGLKSVMMVGLGSSYEDYVKHIFWLKKFENLSSATVTGLRPIPGTPFQNRPMANPLEVAKVGAVARLVLRDVDVGFGGMMNDPRMLPLWIMAGANRAIHLGAHIHRAWSTPIRHPNTVVEKHGEIEFVNMLPLTTRLAKEMGMEVDVE